MCKDIFKKRDKLQQEIEDLWQKILEHKEPNSERFKELCDTRRRKIIELENHKREHNL
jgi:hypothetical protein